VNARQSDILGTTGHRNIPSSPHSMAHWGLPLAILLRQRRAGSGCVQVEIDATRGDDFQQVQAKEAKKYKEKQHGDQSKASPLCLWCQMEVLRAEICSRILSLGIQNMDSKTRCTTGPTIRLVPSLVPPFNLQLSLYISASHSTWPPQMLSHVSNALNPHWQAAARLTLPLRANFVD
jgi:hypothetical protein